MESASVNLESNSSKTLEATIELPTLQVAARSKVDIYLPNPASNWLGPALQESRTQRRLYGDSADAEYDPGAPPQGMLREVDTSFGEPTTGTKKQDLVQSYARRSSKRGKLYTLLILLVLVGAGTWLFIQYESFVSVLLNHFQ